jgi:hypothetical protein
LTTVVPTVVHCQGLICTTGRERKRLARSKLQTTPTVVQSFDWAAFEKPRQLPSRQRLPIIFPRFAFLLFPILMAMVEDVLSGRFGPTANG